MSARVQWTGANLLDMLRTQVKRGIFISDKALVAEGFARSFLDVRRHHINEESVQADNSFHQHGPQLLSGAYGATFSGDILSLAVVSAGTTFAMPAAAVGVFEGLVLDGQAWMGRAGSWDWQVRGRGITVEPAYMQYGFDTQALRRFGAAVSPVREAEWSAFAHRIDEDDSSAAAALVGTRQFVDSDYLVHSQPRYFFSIHMFSKRTIPAACVNDQGKLDRHLSDGATALLLTGHEYDAIWPVLNWSRPPGTTVATAAELPSCANAKHSTAASFVGSVTGGTHGVAVQRLEGQSQSDTLPAAVVAAQHCSGGIRAGSICCAKTCGVCSGDGCSRRAGGAKACCA
jgi:chondroitin AC lyase